MECGVITRLAGPPLERETIRYLTPEMAAGEIMPLRAEKAGETDQIQPSDRVPTATRSASPEKEGSRECDAQTRTEPRSARTQSKAKQSNWKSQVDPILSNCHQRPSWSWRRHHPFIQFLSSLPSVLRPRPLGFSTNSVLNSLIS